MKDNILWDWTIPILMISGAYILAFVVTFAVVMPVQDALLPLFGNFASLLFLPHGVRVIAAWLYGWRSLVFLLPGAVLSHSYLYGSAGFSLDYMIAVFSGVICAAFSFWLFAGFGLDFRFTNRNHVHWRDVMLVGAVSSIINSVGTTVFFGNDLATAAARFIGDVTGMVVSIFILMLIFRALRQIGAPRRT
jgi:hypothetical protein